MTNPTVRIKTNYGTMEAELFSQESPKTVANFLSYVDSSFYNNTLFHRIIPNFMIQGGGLEAGLHQKDGDKETITNEATNGLKNTKYTLSMARLPDPHSATCQFFINISDNDFLDHTGEDNYGYCVFGQINTGHDIALTISAIETEERYGFKDVPKRDVVIETIERVDAQP